MPTGTRFVTPYIQYTSFEGRPYAGGKLYFFEKDTSTPLNTYQDVNLTILNTHPIVLDDRGSPGNVFVGGSGGSSPPPPPPLPTYTILAYDGSCHAWLATSVGATYVEDVNPPLFDNDLWAALVMGFNDENYNNFLMINEGASTAGPTPGAQGGVQLASISTYGTLGSGTLLNWGTVPFGTSVGATEGDFAAYSPATGTILVSVITRNGGSPYVPRISTNNGASWANTSLTSSAGWMAVAFSQNATTMYIHEYQGHIWKSTNSGATWSQLLSSPTYGPNIGGFEAVNTTALKCSKDGTIVASLGGSTTDGCRFSVSTNGGTTWTTTDLEALSGMQANSCFGVGFGMIPDGSGFVAMASGIDPLGGFLVRPYVWTSPDGITWTEVFPPNADDFAGYVINISIDGQCIALGYDRGSGNTFRIDVSTDAGATWTTTTAGPTAVDTLNSIYAIAAPPPPPPPPPAPAVPVKYKVILYDAHDNEIWRRDTTTFAPLPPAPPPPPPPPPPGNGFIIIPGFFTNPFDQTSNFPGGVLPPGPHEYGSADWGFYARNTAGGGAGVTGDRADFLKLLNFDLSHVDGAQPYWGSGTGWGDNDLTTAYSGGSVSPSSIPFSDFLWVGTQVSGSPGGGPIMAAGVYPAQSGTLATDGDGNTILDPHDGNPFYLVLNLDRNMYGYPLTGPQTWKNPSAGPYDFLYSFSTAIAAGHDINDITTFGSVMGTGTATFDGSVSYLNGSYVPVGCKFREDVGSWVVLFQGPNIPLNGFATDIFSSSASGTVTLTNFSPNGVIVVSIHCEKLSPAATVASISDTAGLTWAKRASKEYANSPTGYGANLEIWWAYSPGILTSDVITVTLTDIIDDASIIAFTVNGADTPFSPWDTNVSLPATATGDSVSPVNPTITGVSTDAANTFTFVIGATSENVPSFDAGSGLYEITNVNNNQNVNFSDQDAQYKPTTVALSGATLALGGDWTASPWIVIADAIVLG